MTHMWRRLALALILCGAAFYVFYKDMTINRHTAEEKSSAAAKVLSAVKAYKAVGDKLPDLAVFNINKFLSEYGENFTSREFALFSNKHFFFVKCEDFTPVKEGTDLCMCIYSNLEDICAVDKDIDDGDIYKGLGRVSVEGLSCADEGKRKVDYIINLSK